MFHPIGKATARAANSKICSSGACSVRLGRGPPATNFSAGPTDRHSESRSARESASARRPLSDAWKLDWIKRRLALPAAAPTPLADDLRPGRCHSTRSEGGRNNRPPSYFPRAHIGRDFGQSALRRLSRRGGGGPHLVHVVSRSPRPVRSRVAFAANVAAVRPGMSGRRGSHARIRSGGWGGLGHLLLGNRGDGREGDKGA
jgi:hypothetical protein